MPHSFQSCGGFPAAKQLASGSETLGPGGGPGSIGLRPCLDLCSHGLQRENTRGHIGLMRRILVRTLRNLVAPRMKGKSKHKEGGKKGWSERASVQQSPASCLAPLPVEVASEPAAAGEGLGQWGSVLPVLHAPSNGTSTFPATWPQLLGSPSLSPSPGCEINAL